MAIPVTQCIIKLHEEHHNLEDYQGGVPRWCSGCGDNAILAAGLTHTVTQQGVPCSWTLSQTSATVRPGRSGRGRRPARPVAGWPLRLAGCATGRDCDVGVGTIVLLFM